MLFSLYIFNVFAMGYVVFALERAYGTCMEYIDVVWLLVVDSSQLVNRAVETPLTRVRMRAIFILTSTVQKLYNLEPSVQ